MYEYYNISLELRHIILITPNQEMRSLYFCYKKNISNLFPKLYLKGKIIINRYFILMIETVQFFSQDMLVSKNKQTALNYPSLRFVNNIIEMIKLKAKYKPRPLLRPE